MARRLPLDDTCSTAIAQVLHSRSWANATVCHRAAIYRNLATGGCDVSPFSFHDAPLRADCHHPIPVDCLRQSGRAHGRAAGAQQRGRDADCASHSGKPNPAGDGHLHAGTNADRNLSAHGYSTAPISHADSDIYSCAA